MVQFDLSPSSWAVRWTSNHRRESALCSQIWLRTSGRKISAPPPVRLPSPAAIMSSSTQRTGWQVTRQDQSISTGGQFVGRAVDFKPPPRVGLVLANLVTHLGVEDFGAAAGETPQPGLDHVLEHPADRLFGEAAEPVDLHGGPGLEMERRVGVVEQLH